MKRVKQGILGLSVAAAAFVYVWVAAVRAVPGVRQRKVAARAARGG
jgi:hypothetical protein